eukprot:UN32056
MIGYQDIFNEFEQAQSYRRKHRKLFSVNERDTLIELAKPNVIDFMVNASRTKQQRRITSQTKFKVGEQNNKRSVGGVKKMMSEENLLKEKTNSDENIKKAKINLIHQTQNKRVIN